MAHIWLVMARCGEYSDAFEWPVIAFRGAALAHEHAHRAQAGVATFLGEYHGVEEIREGDLTEDEASELSALDEALVYRPETGPNAGKPFLMSRVAYSASEMPAYSVVRVRLSDA